MIQPVYILENGQRVPYVPIEIKDHREAYAATLHVLFKHVADFHICVVKSFSKKYGIPEDDIMQTIQESEEFKNMRVDPVLHHDGLGYLSPEPVQQPKPAVVQPEPVVVQPEPAVVQPEPAVAKKRIVKKKAQVTPAVEEAKPAPEVTEAKPIPEVTEAKPAPEVTEAKPTIVEKKKVIRKKVQASEVAIAVAEVELDRNDIPIQTPPPPSITTPSITTPITPPSDALAQLLTTDTSITQKKIIRKKK
jgi:hypothetical protein